MVDESDIERLFHAAADLGPGERGAFLNRECAGHDALRAEVERLLAADDAARVGSPFDTPLGVTAPFPLPTLGRYRILEQIGAGGFGLVYLAERTGPMTQRVAIKLIRPGLESRSVIERFEQERQSLASMNHPNIAHVLDAGSTDDGRPYFVMEYVPGRAIDKYCDELGLRIEERLNLFLPVCDAVHHAHTKGVIHRDLKPANILVTEINGRAVPKVIDFGISRATGARDPGLTRGADGTVLLGTPEYMSPEQAEGGSSAIDTRTDVYSLGVVLYKLLTGALPFEPEELGKAGVDEIRRIIREVDPPSPSARVARIGACPSKAQSPTLGDPGLLARTLRRELEWIPMKAMRKDPRHRYSTPLDLKADVERYMSGGALTAGPPSRWYIARKFARRYRTWVSAALLVALSLVGVATMSTLARRREESLRLLAEQRAAQASMALAQAEWSAYTAAIGAAQAAFVAHEPMRLRAWLDAAPPALRSWEWRLLHASADRSLAESAAARPAYSVAVHPSGQIFGAGSEGTVSLHRIDDAAAVHVWSVDATSEVRTPVWAVAFDGDGGRLAAGGQDGKIRVFRTDRPDLPPIEWCAHGRSVNALAFMPGTDWLFSGAGDSTICAWDASAGRCLRELHGHSELVSSLSFSPDGSSLVSGSYDRTVRLWDPFAGTMLAVLGPHADCVFGAAISPDGAIAAVAVQYAESVVWDVLSGRQIARLERPAVTGLSGVCFHPDGAELAAVSWERQLVLYDAHSWGAPHEPMGIMKHGHACAYTPDGSVLVTGAESARVWDVDALRASRPHSAAGAPLVGIEISPSGERLACRAKDGTLRIIDTESREQLAVLNMERGGVSCAAWSRDGLLLASANEDGDVLVRDARDFRLLRRLSAHAGGVRCMEFSGRDGLLAIGQSDGVVVTWDPTSGERRREFGPIGGPVTSMSLSSDGSLISASATRSGHIFLWDAATAHLLHRLEGHTDTVHGLAFSADGSRLYSGSWDCTVRAWHTATGAPLATMTGHQAGVGSIALHPDGDRLVSSGDVIQVWDTERSAPVLTLRHQLSGGLAFSLDGSVLYAVDETGRLTIIDAAVRRRRLGFAKRRPRAEATITR